MTVYIVDIEAVDTRYTKQWKEYLPKQLQRSTNEEVVVISGGEVPQATTPGAFLNFGGTNVYKSNQLMQIRLARPIQAPRLALPKLLHS